MRFLISYLLTAEELEQLKVAVFPWLPTLRTQVKNVVDKNKEMKVRDLA